MGEGGIRFNWGMTVKLNLEGHRWKPWQVGMEEKTFQEEVTLSIVEHDLYVSKNEIFTFQSQ